MITSAPLPSGAVPRIGSLQPLMAVLPAALSRYGLVWSPEEVSGARHVGQPSAGAVPRLREDRSSGRHPPREQTSLLP
ncbi:MAG: hypothetical protein MUF48_15530 [Pirellulaceae bacterium]|nr:hypothetical protein [Pirellulaceae bacterium]